MAKTWRSFPGQSGAMIKLQHKLPRDIFVACSGGVDSMAVFDFLHRNHNLTLCFFDHGTETSKKALEFVSEQAVAYNVGFVYGSISKQYNKASEESWEEYWRIKRYEYFHSFNAPVITAHHLDDCVETWVWSSMHGQGKIIPYNNRNVIRPFRLTRKRDLELWADLKSVPYIEDESNKDTRFTRNYIRHEMMPNVLRVNPGIHKVIAKKVKADESWIKS